MQIPNPFKFFFPGPSDMIKAGKLSPPPKAPLPPQLPANATFEEQNDYIEEVQLYELEYHRQQAEWRKESQRVFWNHFLTRLLPIWALLVIFAALMAELL